MSKPAERASASEVALTHRYRWQLIYCLFTYATPMCLSDIAHQLAVWDHPEDKTELMQERSRIHSALSADHLPALCEAALTTYNHQEDEVDLGRAAPAVEALVKDQLAAEITDLLAAEGTVIEADRTAD